VIKIHKFQKINQFAEYLINKLNVFASQ